MAVQGQGASRVLGCRRHPSCCVLTWLSLAAVSGERGSRELILSGGHPLQGSPKPDCLPKVPSPKTVHCGQGFDVWIGRGSVQSIGSTIWFPQEFQQFTLKGPGFIFFQPVSQISEVEKKQTNFSSLLQKPQSFSTAFVKWNGELSVTPFLSSLWRGVLSGVQLWPRSDPDSTWHGLLHPHPKSTSGLSSRWGHFLSQPLEVLCSRDVLVDLCDFSLSEWGWVHAESLPWCRSLDFPGCISCTVLTSRSPGKGTSPSVT